MKQTIDSYSPFKLTPINPLNKSFNKSAIKTKHSQNTINDNLTSYKVFNNLRKSEDMNNKDSNKNVANFNPFPTINAQKINNKSVSLVKKPEERNVGVDKMSERDHIRKKKNSFNINILRSDKLDTNNINFTNKINANTTNLYSNIDNNNKTISKIEVRSNDNDFIANSIKEIKRKKVPLNNSTDFSSSSDINKPEKISDSAKKSNNKKSLSNTYNEVDQLSFKSKSISCISYKTLPGRINAFKQKQNQDSFLIMTNIFDIVGFNIFGVFDGHGTNGHLSSDFTKKFFELFFNRKSTYLFENPEEIKLTELMQKEKKSDLILKKDEIYKKLQEKNYLIIRTAFKLCESALMDSVNFDNSLSGTTANITFSICNHLICANTGDSRSIFIEENSIIGMSNDHKPELIQEKKRILSKGGLVHPIKDNGRYVGPHRVWTQSGEYPGLSMSRSLGDFVAKSVGCSAEPGKFIFIRNI